MQSLQNINNNILKIYLSLTPLFLVTISSWSSIILITGSIFAFGFYFTALKKIDRKKHTSGLNVILIISTLAAPFLSIILSSILREKFQWSDYDSASRFLIAIVIFLFGINTNINASKYFQYTIPASLFITVLHQLFFTQPKFWGIDRMSTYFSDPLVFGFTSLTFGLTSLVSINLISKDKPIIVAFKIIGFIIGIYLSIMSGSRTGWLAIPLVILVFINYHAIFRMRSLITKTTLFSFIVLAIAILFTYSANSGKRMLLASNEFLNYSWSGVAPDTSIGQRITFLRIAFDMFVIHPFSGYGDTSKGVESLSPKIYSYASPESLRMAFNSGFHNEIVTNTIRYGVAGLVSSISIFVIPLVLFFDRIQSEDSNQKANSLVGIVFTICFFISSCSTEVFDLKYMASFYALTITMLCASVISKRETNQKSM